MGQFTIDLQDKGVADVRWGKVIKKRGFLSLFKPGTGEIAKGYIVRLANEKNGQETYRIFKTHTGKWSTDPDGVGKLDSDLLMQIKDAILSKELSHT